ncbi:MAG: NAD-dependent epimerase/dehydratase family protein [Nitrospirota bacterium]
MESVLVTGGAGFIGSNIAEALLLRGYRVVVLDDLSTGSMQNILALQDYDNLKFIHGSILDAGLLRSIIKTESISLVSHQAAVPSVSKSVKDPLTTIGVNVTGTTTLFQTAAEYGCKRIVFASSSSVYGDTAELPKREGMSLNPKSPYAVSKASKEMLARVFSNLYDLEIVGLRYFNVYGRRQNPASDYAAVIPTFITRALRNEPLPIEGDGMQTRDFSYIDDVVSANLQALTRNVIQGNIFNIAYGERITVLDLAELIRREARSSSEIVYRPKRSGDVRDSLADVTLARTQLAYEPRFPIQQGIVETISWYRTMSSRRCGFSEKPIPLSHNAQNA